LNPEVSEEEEEEEEGEVCSKVSVAQYGDCDFVSIVSPEHLCDRFVAVRSYIFMLIKLGNRVMNIVSPCVTVVVMLR
jgi:hypothetical protein